MFSLELDADQESTRGIRKISSKKTVVGDVCSQNRICFPIRKKK